MPTEYADDENFSADDKWNIFASQSFMHRIYKQ